MPRYWLFKSEPGSYSFERLRKDGTTPWSGVRNYQARNTMLEMRAGDLALFYHSSVPEPSAVGICMVVREAYADSTAFERDGQYFDPRSTPERTIWQMVDVAFVEPLRYPVTLARMRAQPRLAGMQLLRKGSRLSVQPVTPREWKIVLALSRRPR